MTLPRAIGQRLAAFALSLLIASILVFAVLNLLPGDGEPYEKYVEEGEDKPRMLEAYNSANTTRLDVEQTKELLQTLPEVRLLLERGL